MSLQVCEIFHSIQGESTRAGYPCIFIRLAGCNLRCTYCDTVYAQTVGTEYTVQDIIAAVSKYPCRLVEITGGEPLLQDTTPHLVCELLDRDYIVLLETNGTIALDGLDNRCIKIVDVKCPASGEGGSFNERVLAGLSEHDELKFVISDRNDYEFACDFLKCQTGIRVAAVHFSPVMSRLPIFELASWILADGLSVRCAPQLHRYIWPDTMRGV
jgi:7-carboxy-7-deazaguanine synthase